MLFSSLFEWGTKKGLEFSVACLIMLFAAKSWNFLVPMFCDNHVYTVLLGLAVNIPVLMSTFNVNYFCLQLPFAWYNVIRLLALQFAYYSPIALTPTVRLHKIVITFEVEHKHNQIFLTDFSITYATLSLNLSILFHTQCSSLKAQIPTCGLFNVT